MKSLIRTGLRSRNSGTTECTVHLKRAARVDAPNGQSPGSDEPMVTALKIHNGGRVLV